MVWSRSYLSSPKSEVDSKTLTSDFGLKDLGEDRQLLVGAADDRLRVNLQPLGEHRAVHAAEVDGVAQVFAVEPLRRLERWVLGVQPALHVVADDERTAAGAVVGAAAVVFDPPAELGKDQDGDVVRRVVLAEVLQEGSQRTGQFGEQLRVAGQLLSVVVVAAMLRIEDACAQPG